MGTPLELVEGLWRDNCVVPLFWQHGEDHAVLLEELEAIHASGIRGFIAEARPFAGYLEPPWWQTLEFLCAQAERLDMSVWVFDDGHFPSGFAGGLVQAQRPDLTRQLIRCAFGEVSLKAGEEILARVLLSPEVIAKLPPNRQNAASEGEERKRGVVTTPSLSDEAIAPCREGGWDESFAIASSDGMNRVLSPGEVCPSNGQVATLILTREGGERHTAPYINFLSSEAVEFYLNTIYRPHYEHLRRYAGNVFQGFFSDEPRFGNAPSYLTRLGQPEVHLPWEQSMPEEISALLGHDCLADLPLLWTNGAPCAQRAVRQAYMEAVTRRFGDVFSARVGEWCRSHGLKHIGHVIEDNGSHVRLGYGPGHYFRSQKGQYWAGVDTVLLQQGPGRTDGWTKTAFGNYDNRFYHWGLAKLASSCAKLDPTMQGSFVEIFGAYGWHAGLPFQKWLVDHFAVRGVNHFVPHAFSPAAFPDLDCPPHFYARGQNPQWRLFPWLVAYMQRMGNLLADGQSVASIGLLYHAEGEWSGEACEPFESLVPPLAKHQLDFDVIDLDHLAKATMQDGVYTINGHSYRLLVMPASASVPQKMVGVLEKLLAAKVAVALAGTLPDALPEAVARGCQCITAEELPALAWRLGLADFRCTPVSPNLRVLHWQDPNGDSYLCLNESLEETLDFDYETPVKRSGAMYFPADNTLWRAEGRLSLAPGQTVVLWFPYQSLPEMPCLGTIEQRLSIPGKWCVAIRPVGGFWQELAGVWDAGQSLDGLPALARFSGDLRFRLEFTMKRPSAPRILIALAGFNGAGSWSLNGVALPPLCGAPCQAEVTDCLKEGLNALEIIQSTTPHRLYPDSVFDRDFAPEPLVVPAISSCSFYYPNCLPACSSEI